MDVLIPAAQAYGYQPDYVVATDDLPQGGRPAPFMALKNVIELGVTDVRACIKVDDAVPGIDEGHNAGMWTVGLLLSGNEAGLTEQEYLSADEATLNTARARARDKLSQANPHYLIDTIADFPAVVADIERRLLARRTTIKNGPWPVFLQNSFKLEMIVDINIAPGAVRV